MGQCHCLGNHSTDEAEDALLRNYEEQQQRQEPIGPPPPYQQAPLSFYMLTEEQQVHLISRITLIQSLPSGRYECHKVHQGKVGEKVDNLCPEKPGATAAATAMVPATAPCAGEEKATAAVAAAACPEKTDLGEKTDNKECPICMNDFLPGDQIRLLPCMHYYHLRCIDDWLMRSLTCPTCMQRVDLAMRSPVYSSQPHLMAGTHSQYSIASCGSNNGAGSRSSRTHSQYSIASRGSNSGAGSRSSSMERLTTPHPPLLPPCRTSMSPPTSPLRLIAEVSHH